METPETPVQTFRIAPNHGYSEAINAIAVSPDGKYFASASHDHLVKVRDADTRALVQDFAGHTDWARFVCFSPSGSMLLSAGHEGAVNLWDLVNPAPPKLLDAQLLDMPKLAISEDRAYLVGAPWRERVRIYSLADGTLFREFEYGEREIRACAISHARGVYLLEDQHGELSAFRMTTGDHIWTIKISTLGNTNLALSPEGGLLAATNRDNRDHRIKILDVNTGEVVHVIEDQARSFYSTLFLPGTNSIMSDESANIICVWNYLTGELQLSIKEKVGVFAFNPTQARFIAEVSAKKMIGLDIKDGSRLFEIPGHNAVPRTLAFTSTGSQFITGDDGGEIQCWDLGVGSRCWIQASNHGTVYCAAVAPSEPMVATAGSDGTMRLWDLNTGVFLHAGATHKNSITCIAFSPDGQQILTGDSEGWVKLYDRRKGRVMKSKKCHTFIVELVRFRDQGNSFFTASGEYIFAWKAASMARTHVIGKFSNLISSAVMLPSMETFAVLVGCDLILWNHQKQAQEWSFQDARLHPISLATSPDGRFIAVGFQENIVRVWDASGLVVMTFPHKSSVTALAFHPDGTRLPAGDTTGEVCLWRIRS